MRFIVENKKFLILIVIVLILCTSCKYNDINVKYENTPSKEEIIENVILYDNSLDFNFVSIFMMSMVKNL